MWCSKKSNRSHFIHRILSMLVGCLSMFGVGFLYSFSIYTNAIKYQYNYTQTQVDMLMTLSNMGQSVGFVQGFAQELLGIKGMLILTLVLVLGSNGLIFSSTLNPAFYQQHHWLLAFYYFIFGLACSMMYISPPSINIPNFEQKSKGKVMGVTFCSFYIGCSVTSLLYFTYFCPSEDPQAADLSGYFLAQAFFQTAAVTLCLLFLDTIPLRRRRDTDDFEEDDILALEESVGDDTGCVAAEEAETGLARNILRMFSSLNFYLILLPFIFTSGITLVVYSNIVVYASSFGFSAEGGILSVLQYVFSCAGALGTGFLSDFFLDAVPRATFALALELPLAILLACSIYFLYSFMFMAAFDVVGLLMEGQCYMLASMMISDEFGAKHFGTNWGITLFVSGLFTFCTEGIFSRGYDLHVAIDESTCYGLWCYTFSSGFFSILMGVSTIITAILVARKFKARKSVLNKPESCDQDDL